MATGDHIATIDGQLPREKQMLERVVFWLVIACAGILFFGSTGWILATDYKAKFLALQAQQPLPAADPAEWSQFTSDKGNRWLIRDASVVAILDVSNEKDAETLGRRTVIHLPGLKIGSKLSIDEIAKEVRNVRESNE